MLFVVSYLWDLLIQNSMRDMNFSQPGKSRISSCSLLGPIDDVFK